MKQHLLLSFLLSLSLLSLGQNIPSYVPTNGLVGWWPFNGNANDESGNGNHGTVNGATLTTDRFGDSGKAYRFDGVDDYISTNFLPPTGTNSRSISVWFKWNDIAPSDNAIVAYGANSPNCIQAGGNFEIGLFNLSPTFFRLDGVCSAVYTVDSVNSNWHNGFIVYESSFGSQINNIKLYIDGKLMSSQSYNGTTTINTLSANNFLIGKSATIQNRFFNGLIDDIAIWNRALDSAEITQLYQTQSINSNSPGFVGINISNPTRNLHIKDVMKLEPRDTAPNNPTRGDIYYDGTLNKLRVYDGATWQNCW